MWLDAYPASDMLIDVFGGLFWESGIVEFVRLWQIVGVSYQ